VNNSKKLIYNPQEVKKTKKVRNPMIWIVTSIILVVILLGGVLFDQLYKRVILTIDGDKYNMDDLSYYFYGVESKYDYINQLYGGTYYDTVEETTGLTYREAAKQEAVTTAIYNEIMYREAIANDYSLTAEEIEQNNTDITSMLTAEVNKALLKKNPFTKKYLSNVMGKATLTARYRQDVIDTLDIDDEALKAEINLEDNRQYDVEYLHISTKVTNDDGTSVAMSEEEKAAAYAKINAVYETSLTTKDWSTLIPEGETELKYLASNFIKSDTKFSDEFKTMMMGMENNSVSEIYEAEDEYYIVRMINNNSTETYDSKVEEAITSAEDEAFSKVYAEIIPKHKYIINEKELAKYKMGEITLVN